MLDVAAGRMDKVVDHILLERLSGTLFTERTANQGKVTCVMTSFSDMYMMVTMVTYALE